mmetsp:Transcript_42864/g.83835  ORF Transcript_42864/g.83835 Transcript_42864/m.83835 type:complete len:238 (+) Transcript_42864:194-907(+)
MLIRQHAVDGTLLTVDLAPRLGKGREEEPLLRLGAGRRRQRPERELQPPRVGNVLAKRQLAVDGLVQHLVLVKHPRDARAALLESLDSLRVPPVTQLPLRVVLRPIIIERVRHLMPQDGPHAAVVLGIRVSRVEEGLLKDTRGDPQSVALRPVEGIDLQRRAAPPRPTRHALRKLVEGTLHAHARADLPVAVKVPPQLALEHLGAGGPVDLALLVGGDAHLEEHCVELTLCSLPRRL